MSDFDAFFQRTAQATGVDTQQELAELLRVNRSAVTQAKKRGVIPEKWLLKLTRDYGLNPDWLEFGAGSMHLSGPAADSGNYLHVPKVRARLSAGGGSFEVDARTTEYYPFNADWLQHKGRPDSMVLMDVFGNSMEPEIKEGDTALIDQSQDTVLAGGVYAVGVEDTVMIKRIEKRPNALVLISDNPDYESIYLSGQELENVRIIGKLVWLSREFR